MHWRTHKRIAAQAGIHLDRSDKGQNRPRAKFTPVGESTDDAMGDALLEPADDESVEDEARASHHLAKLWPKTTRMECFSVSDEERVKKFLLGRISKLHQLTNKKVAKAWIKGICPKKQAHFPYQNKKIEAQGFPPEVPGWWPPTPPSRANDFSNRSSFALHANENDDALSVDFCPFIEPDHVKKHERNLLLLHLLRLRPTPEQLQAWNRNTTKPSKTHRRRGWTALLKELAPVQSLDDVSAKDKKVSQYRRQLFEELYDVAEMEQEWKALGIDRKFYYTPDPEKKLGKRSMRAAASTIFDDNEPASSRRASVDAPLMESVNGPRRLSPVGPELSQSTHPSPSADERVAETRQPDFLTLPTANDFDVAESNPSVNSTSEDSCSSSHDQKRTTLAPARHRTRRKSLGRPASKRLNGARKKESSLQPSHPQTRWKIEPQWQQWQATTASLKNAVGDVSVNDGPVQNGQAPSTAPSFFPGSHQSVFTSTPQYHHQQQSRQHTSTSQQSQPQVFNVIYLSQPYFEPAPYTADFLPSSFAYAQDSQIADPPMSMSNYGVSFGPQSILSAAAPVPHLPSAPQFHEEQSHPIHGGKDYDCKPIFCLDSADRKSNHFQQMLLPYGEPCDARNQPTRRLSDGLFAPQI